MIGAIYESLEYWLKAIEWFENKNGTPKSFFTTEYSQQLCTVLIQQANIWQSLMLGQQTLQMITNQHVTNEILNQFIGNIERTIGQDIANAFNWGVRKVKNVFFVAFPFIALVILLLLMILIVQSGPLPASYKEVITPVLGVLGVVGGFFISQAQKINVGSDLTTIANAAGSAGSAFFTIYQEGYNRVQDEFARLNYNVSVASPLVQFFITQFPKKTDEANSNLKDFQGKTGETPVCIKNHYDFLIHIAWTDSERAEETEEITRSAFGAIGVLVGSLLRFPSRRTRVFPSALLEKRAKRRLPKVSLSGNPKPK